MDCNRVKELMMDYLYQELPPAEMEDFRASLAHCPECAAELAAMTRTRQAFAALPDVPAPEGSLAAILAAARAQAPTAPKPQDGLFTRMWLSVAAHPAMAAVASLVLVGGIAGFLTMTGRVSLTPPPVHETAQAPTSGAAPAPAAAAAPDEEPKARPAVPGGAGTKDAPSDGQGADPAGAVGGVATERSAESARRAKLAPEATNQKLDSMPSKRGRAGAALGEGQLAAEQGFAKGPDSYGAGAGAGAEKGGSSGARKGADEARAETAPPMEQKKEVVAAKPSSTKSRTDEQPSRELADEAQPESPPAAAAPRAAPSAPAPTGKSTSDGNAAESESDDASPSREKATELHRQARAAAKAGDCKRAVRLFSQIAEVDAAYAESSTNRAKDLGACARTTPPIQKK